MNLLNETVEAISASGHKPEDVVFIGSELSGHQCTWEEFKCLADAEYDDGFGAQEVAMDLIFVFRDGQKMWRGEHDGSEWWNISTPFVRPKNKKKISVLIKGMWESLSEMND